MGLLFLHSIPRGLAASIAGLLFLTMAGSVSALSQTPTAQTGPSIQRAVGSIKAITDNGITLASDTDKQLM